MKLSSMKILVMVPDNIIIKIYARTITVIVTIGKEIDSKYHQITITQLMSQHAQNYICNTCTVADKQAMRTVMNSHPLAFL